MCNFPQVDNIQYTEKDSVTVGHNKIQQLVRHERPTLVKMVQIQKIPAATLN